MACILSLCFCLNIVFTSRIKMFFFFGGNSNQMAESSNKISFLTALLYPPHYLFLTFSSILVSSHFLFNDFSLCLLPFSTVSLFYVGTFSSIADYPIDEWFIRVKRV
jgi:hypothetical protein